MRTVVVGPPPSELTDLLEARHVHGADLFDEVWDGDYHMAPAPNQDHALIDDELGAILRPLAHRRGLLASGPFNLGFDRRNYRVPDRGVHRARTGSVWNATAAIAVEIVSPHDESWAKFDFYAAHEVDEVVIVDPEDRSVAWFQRAGQTYEPTTRSTVLDVEVAEVAAAIAWPGGPTEP